DHRHRDERPRLRHRPRHGPGGGRPGGGRRGGARPEPLPAVALFRRHEDQAGAQSLIPPPAPSACRRGRRGTKSPRSPCIPRSAGSPSRPKEAPMPVKNRFAELLPEITAWRHDFHRHPELLFEVHRTAARVAELCRGFGCDEVVEGVGQTGVAAVIRGRTDTTGRGIGLRADMDALPIHERTGAAYASETPGRMHACGHDGHTAMLLGAAKYLAETRNFDGT